MAASVNDDEKEEWEYEYSMTETETYYVDLDLSSVNGVIKSQNAGERKTIKRQKSPVGDKTANKNQDRAELDENNDGPNDNVDNDIDNEQEAGDNQDVIDPALPQSPPELGLLDDDYTGQMQILDLNTTNPIVSFNGHLYSCTWHDMLGTSLFITKHQEAPFHEPEISTEDYDLISTSRIKLVGRRAKILSKASSKKRRRENDETDVGGSVPSAKAPQYNVQNGKSLGTITRTNPRTNIEIKQQASFLERLMEVKQSRGEHDVVRTFVDRRTVAADARQARKAKRVAKDMDREKEKVTVKAKEKAKEKEETAEQRLRREINELNKRVVKGDNEALEKLQEIYADMEEVDDEEDEVLIQNTSAPALASTRSSPGNAGNPRIPADGGGQEIPHVADTNPNGASGSAGFD